MAKVFWTPWDEGFSSDYFACVDAVFAEPIPFTTFLERTSNYVTCYAYLDTCKNAYVITAPFDMNIFVNPTTKVVTVDNIHPDMFRAYCGNKIDQTGVGDPQIISMPPRYVFHADSSVTMELLPMWLVDQPENTSAIPGRFDIGKWIRPMDWEFEVKDPSKPVVVKRGDPLLIARFSTPNDEKIELVRVAQTDVLVRAVSTCTKVKMCVKKTPLKRLYRMAEAPLKLLGFGLKEEPWFCRMFRKK